MTEFKCKICGRVGDLDMAINSPEFGLICAPCDLLRTKVPPSENTCVCCGEVIPEGEQVCLHCQRIEHPLYLEKLKRTHAKISDLGEWNTTEPEKEPPVDIHKIIDDAMEKRDRTVSIFISAENNAVSVNVYPVDHDKVYWKADPDGLICTNCGLQDQSYYKYTYCPGCGELMHGIR